MEERLERIARDCFIARPIPPGELVLDAGSERECDIHEGWFGSDCRWARRRTGLTTLGCGGGTRGLEISVLAVDGQQRMLDEVRHESRGSIRDRLIFPRQPGAGATRSLPRRGTRRDGCECLRRRRCSQSTQAARSCCCCAGNRRGRGCRSRPAGPEEHPRPDRANVRWWVVRL